MEQNFGNKNGGLENGSGGTRNCCKKGEGSKRDGGLPAGAENTFLAVGGGAMPPTKRGEVMRK